MAHEDEPHRPAKAADTANASSQRPNVDADYASQWRRSLADSSTQQKFLTMLSRVQIFAQLSEAARLSVCQDLQPVQYKANELVYSRGDAGDWMGIVLSGKLEYYMERESPEIGEGGEKTRTPQFVSAGATIGDINTLGVLERRSMTVVAAVPSTLLVLSRKSFEAALTAPKDHSFLESMEPVRNKAAMDRRSFCSSPIFRKLGFTEDFLAALFDRVEQRLLYPGQVLMREGGYGNSMYLLHSGTVSIEKGNKVVASLSDGVALGELAVLGSDKRRRATVLCSTVCLVIVIHGEVLAELLEDLPHCRSTFHHAYIKTLVGDGLTNGLKDEMKQLDTFYGSVHPLTNEEMIRQGFGGTTFAIMKTNHLRRGSDGPSQRPGSAPSARKWVPTKIPSRPSTAAGPRRPQSACRWERTCVASLT